MSGALRRRRRRISPPTLVLAVALVCASVAAGCGDDSPTGPTAAAPAAATPPVVEMPEPTPPDDTTKPAEREVTIPNDLAVTLTPVLAADTPVDLVHNPVTGAMVLASKTGQVRIVDLAAGTSSEPVLDLSGQLASDSQEQGLLGIEIHPDGGSLYTNHTRRDGTTVITEWTLEGDVVDLGSGRIILTVDQPAANHNGGDLAFSPDGLLHIALGDGGGADDQFGNGQDPETLLGTILRIDPRRGNPYAVPAENPFVERGGRPEVRYYGLRNPWRMDFDDATGDLWIADVGQRDIEEIDVLYASGSNAGTNLGWPLVEGSAPFDASGPPADGYVAPVYEYGHDEGCSVTGGVVYRGSAIPELDGVYLFGDYCTSELWGLASSETQGLVGRFSLGVGVGSGLSSFGQDGDGEVYLLSIDGTVSRLEPA